MAWTIDEAETVASDLTLIFDHLFEHQMKQGYGPDEAAGLAARRISAIRELQVRLAMAPHIGTRHRIGHREIRNVTLDRTVFWFTLDESREIVSIEGVFHGGQDHLGRMLARLEAEGGDG